MSYDIIIPKSAQKEINRLPSNFIEEVVEKLKQLKENPRSLGCKKLEGREGWRIRVGNYRIIYEIDDKGKTVTLFRVMHRRDVYR